MTIAPERAQTETRALRMLRSGDSVKDVAQATGLTAEEIAKLQRDFPGPAPTPTSRSASPCDFAGCRGLATTRAQGWAFCDTHAADHAKQQADEAAEKKAAASSPIGRLLEDASGHTVLKVRNLAARIETQLVLLRALIAEHAETEEARRREAEERARAKAEVVRLEKELAAAKARLKGKPTPITGTHSCEDCGQPVSRKGPRGPWPKRCDSCKAGPA